MNNKDTINDRMVRKTVIPAIYLWLLASGAVVAMGIFQPDIVLANLDGFIALIAIIGYGRPSPVHHPTYVGERADKRNLRDADSSGARSCSRHR